MDGYIAGPNGEIDWLEEAGSNLDYGYHDFYSSIDIVVAVVQVATTISIPP